MSLSDGAAQHSYTFQITLLAVTPPVWRLVAVPGRLKLSELHDVIQLAMGWERKHSYRFDIAGKNYQADRRAGDSSEAIDPASLTLDQLQLGQGSSLTYIYDFKDDWIHHLTVQGVAPSTLAAPALLGGAGACPPETSGGPGGYSAMIAALKAPNSAAGKAAKEKLGDRTDPAAWDAGPASRGLPQVSPQSAPAATPAPAQQHQQSQPHEHRSKKNRRNRR